ncbi:MAG: hypothetical protein PHD91_07420, partial [bacterium]|nr:hypothetical protein [bacterium]
QSICHPGFKADAVLRSDAVQSYGSGKGVNVAGIMLLLIPRHPVRFLPPLCRRIEGMLAKEELF